MDYPQVSILIPLYNSEKYIAETLQSAINQVWPNKEIIVVDDGSTDQSYAIAKSFESNIVKIYRQKNKGACAARNYAFEISSGEYIQYLDADDLLSPNKIEAQMQLFDVFGNKILTSCSWVRFVDNINNISYTKRAIDKNYKEPVDWFIDSSLGKGCGAQHMWLIPRQTIITAGKWNESLAKNQDGEFFCRVLVNSERICYSQKALVYYRDTPDSITNRKNYRSSQSMLLSYELYTKHTERFASNIRLKKALATCFSIFYSCTYPNYPDLLQRAIENINKLGYNRLPIHGGRIFKLLSFLVGVKMATLVRYKLSNFKNVTIL